MQQLASSTKAREKGGLSKIVPAHIRIPASKIIQYKAVIIQKRPITIYNSECCIHAVAEEGQNAKHNHFSSLIACLLISSLLFCISAAILRCSSALLALMRASSSAAAAQIGLSDFEYSFSLRTNLLKSSCL